MGANRGRNAVRGLAMLLAVAGIVVSLAGQQFGHPFLESHVGPAVTLSGAVLWLGFRAFRR